MERLLAACTATGIERIVFASTLAVYGGTRVSPWDEDALLLPVTAYGRSKAEGEAMVRGSGLCWRIARLGTVFGTGDRANFMRLASALRRRRFVLPGKGSARKSVLPVGRAGEVLGRLALLTEKRGILVNCAMPVAPSLAEICAAFGEACGFPSPPRVPVSLLKIAGRMGDLVGTRAPLNSSVLRKLTVDTVVHVERMQSLLPDLEWSDFPAALVPAVEYYRSCGR
jgi:UDP-glucose 4-epimerase